MHPGRYQNGPLWTMLFVIMTLLAANDDSRAQNPEVLAQRLQATYTTIDSMSFSFSQTTSGPMTGRPKSGKGNGLYARTAEKPLMRWKAQTDILFSFFAASEPLDRHFTILPVFVETDIAAEDIPEMQSLQLEPLDKNSQIQTINLWIGGDSLIRRIDLLDHFDTKTTINLSNIVINPFAAKDQQDVEAQFTFIPPEGTEIIRQ
ncbi:MAG: outer membrane lipoprotein carrier protein LolA [Desulfofustis sp.]